MGCNIEKDSRVETELNKKRVDQLVMSSMGAD